MTHPIAPPPELIKEWRDQWFESDRVDSSEYVHIATQAASWGSDQELEACCEWFVYTHPDDRNLGALRAARRPKPPSLKEEALAALAAADGADHPAVATVLTADQHATIRRALESLPD